jgi:DNA-binding response OmpR family regulator
LCSLYAFDLNLHREECAALEINVPTGSETSASDSSSLRYALQQSRARVQSAQRGRALAQQTFDISKNEQKLGAGLAYLVKHAGREVAQDELLGALWTETFVNPEVLRKYLLEIRKALNDRPNSPEFIETLPKRGYRFVAPVVDANTASQGRT